MDKNQRIIGLVAIVFFMPFLGKVHLFDWDEINFAEIAREMLVTGEYLRPQIYFEFFTEKPPLFMWLQAGSMHLFGVGEYAARFPNTIAGLITLLLLYRLGTKLYDRTFGWLWAGAYFGSILSHLYFRSGIIDPWFNLFIFLGLYHLLLFYWHKNTGYSYTYTLTKWQNLIWAGVFTGLGILVKGPVAFLIISLCLGVYWIWNKFKFFITPLEYLSYTLITLLTASLWFGVVTLLHGPQFAIEFTIRQWELFANQDAGHGGFFGYHFVVLLIGMFPTSVFFIRGLWKPIPGKPIQNNMRRWMLILFWVVLILFSVVSTKIVHYSSMAYYPITYIAALVIWQMQKGAYGITGWMKGILYTIALLFGGILIALPWVGNNIHVLEPLLAADPFAVANLQAENHWTVLDALPGLVLIGVTLASIILMQRKQVLKGAVTLFGGMGIFIFLTLALILNNIEHITQRAAIEFYETKQGCDCYVVNEEYKSYATMFYSRVQPIGDHRRANAHWLKHGKIDKDAYFVAKITGTQHLEKLPDIEFLYEKNGFTFWKRSAVKHPEK